MTTTREPHPDRTAPVQAAADTMVRDPEAAPRQSGPGARLAPGARASVFKPADILALQQTSGNRAVQRMLERPGPRPGDRANAAAGQSTAIQRFQIVKSYPTHQEVRFTRVEEQPDNGLYKDDGYFYEPMGSSGNAVLYERKRIDRAQGAVAVYRGLHFRKTWSDEKYKDEIGKLVKGTPTFSSAVYEIAIRVAKSEKVTTEQLYEAFEVVQQDLKKMERYQDKDKPENKRKYQHREGGTRPREAGEDERYTRKGRDYLNQLAAALSLYINNQKEFEKQLQKAEEGDFAGLHFVKIPFISTSKSPSEAAKYAKGKVQEEADVRTEGTVGRIYVYVAPLKQMQEQGAVDVVESHRHAIYICEWRFGEKEVSFMGQIPPQFLRGDTLVQADQSAEAAGQEAQKIAEAEGAKFGGLKEYTMKIV